MKVIFHQDFYQVYTFDPAAAAGRMEAITGEIGPHVDFIDAEKAPEEDIASVHIPHHITHVRENNLYYIASLAAGGAIQAAETGLREPCFGLIRPPGHHASSGSSWGFCYFNNMAIAIEHMRRTGKINTAYVLDIDLHFGDGTVNILNGKDYVKVHNIGAHRREDYMVEVADEMDRCNADIIGISAGFDNHEEDWGGTLSTEDYGEIGRMARKAARRNRGGCFGILEGGYNHEVLGRNVLELLKGLSQT